MSGNKEEPRYRGTWTPRLADPKAAPVSYVPSAPSAPSASSTPSAPSAPPPPSSKPDLAKAGKEVLVENLFENPSAPSAPPMDAKPSYPSEAAIRGGPGYPTSSTAMPSTAPPVSNYPVPSYPPSAPRSMPQVGSYPAAQVVHSSYPVAPVVQPNYNYNVHNTTYSTTYNQQNPVHVYQPAPVQTTNVYYSNNQVAPPTMVYTKTKVKTKHPKYKKHKMGKFKLKFKLFK